MQRLQGWVRYAASQLPAGTSKPAQQQAAQEEEDEFIYGRVAVHSDDEEPVPHSRAVEQQQHRASAPDSSASHSQRQQQQQPGMQQDRQQHSPGLRPMHHQHSYSDTDLTEFRAQAAQTQEPPELIRLDSGDEQQPGWAADWAAFNDPQATTAAAGTAAAAAGAAAALGDSSRQQPQVGTSSSTAAAAEAVAGTPTPAAAPAAAAAGNGSSGNAPAAPLVFEAPTSSSCFETGEEVPDHDHTQERRELIIYAIPLTRGKVIFLPVCPWRSDPEAGPGWKKAVSGHVSKVQGEASDMWQKMAAAEQGSAVHRLYKFGKRLLDGIPAEERLMRGVPKNVSKVIIHHPMQVCPETIMEQMQTMTRNYGIKAVGRAAAATVMLPLAIGVDLIILPGPQVLTYYTMWNLYRNTNGALGTSRMTKFITQGGSSANIRVNYVAEPKLDKYYDAANDCPEGVLSEDDIDALVSDLREPDLLEPLLSLRSKALRDAGARTSSGGGGGGEYTALPPTDPAAGVSRMGGGGGAAAADRSQHSTAW